MLYANDGPTNVTDYVIADYLREDRRKQIWQRDEDRPLHYAIPAIIIPARRLLGNAIPAPAAEARSSRSDIT
jgi:hypothetical protein